MAYTPNPPVPYVGPLTGVSNGVMIHIGGQPTQNAKWFAINLQCGPNTNPRDDIALHINPRFEGNTSKIVRNSLQAQQWGIEENYGHFPLVVNQPFEILILVEQDHFKIAINGQHYTEFRYRLPFNRINTLTVDGDVQLFKIQYEGGSAGLAPGQVPSNQIPNPTMQMGAGGLSPGGQQYGHSPGRSPSPQPQGYGQTGYGMVPQGQMNPQQPIAGGAYGAPPGYGAPAYSGQPHAGGYGGYQSSQPMNVPYGGKSPKMGKKGKEKGGMGWGHVAGGAAAGAVGGYALSRLAYPGHGGGYGHGMGGMHGHKGMKKNKGMKKLYKHKHHKPKFHKFKHHKFHHKHHGKSSSSSSSSEEE